MGTTAPASLIARSGEGEAQVVIAAGAALPAAGRVVCATTRGGQDALVLAFSEGEAGPGEAAHPLGLARFPLPRGLPANCWIPVEIHVDEALSLRAEARENLRRLRIPAEWGEVAAGRRYQVAP
jgi:hypothetical protein